MHECNIRFFWHLPVTTSAAHAALAAAAAFAAAALAAALGNDRGAHALLQ